MEQQHMFKIFPTLISITDEGVTMKILKYVCSNTICMLISWYTFPSKKSHSSYAGTSYHTLLNFKKVDNATTQYQTLRKWINHNTTRYQTLYHTCYFKFSPSLTWVGHNVLRYHDFNVLPYAFTYIFSQLSMVWGYLQCDTMHYRQNYEKNVY